MAIFNFQKPDKVIMIDSTDFEGKFEFRPLEPGYGLTVGNALRRVLLSALEGYAITSIRIDGVEHEFSTISGVVEDVTDVVAANVAAGAAPQPVVAVAVDAVDAD
jgi:DNA-directed RNA polymerase subunit alpha